MENSNFSTNRQQNDPLGVNKIGKIIRKIPLHQTNLPNPKHQQQQQQPQPHVYNISKNDFRNIVQQLTGSPSHPPALPLPNPPKPPSMRLQKIRPPPLSPITRPSAPLHFNHNPENPNTTSSNSHISNSPFFGQFTTLLNTAESPISAHMRYLQTSAIDSSPGQLQSQGQAQPQSSSSGILPTPPAPVSASTLLPSPSNFLNLLSPLSPYPLLSPGFQFPSPLTPNFSFSPLSPAPGILGSGPQPPPLSPGAFLPSGFFSFSSPRWRT